MSVDLVPFAQLPALAQFIGTRTLQRLSRQGKAPPFVRLTPNKPMWSRSSVERWLKERLAPLSPAAEAPARAIEFVDGEPPEVAP